jgi:LmbE family N-acetylglucosaminyl deacetylase
VDHHVLARVARLALALVGFEGEAWGYEVWTPLVPTRIVDITDVYERKARAVNEHASQLEYRDLNHKALAITAQRAMYLSDDARHGEAFRPLGEVGSEDRGLL